jgi:hypothetical protein
LLSGEEKENETYRTENFVPCLNLQDKKTYGVTKTPDKYHYENTDQLWNSPCSETAPVASLGSLPKRKIIVMIWVRR